MTLAFLHPIATIVLWTMIKKEKMPIVKPSA
jgi:hypothetical protein